MPEMSFNKFLDTHEFQPSIEVTIIEDGDSIPIVLITGDKDTFLFLSDLFCYFAQDKEFDKVSLSPDGAGHIYFSKHSRYGIYLKKRSP